MKLALTEKESKDLAEKLGIRGLDQIMREASFTLWKDSPAGGKRLIFKFTLDDILYRLPKSIKYKNHTLYLDIHKYDKWEVAYMRIDKTPEGDPIYKIYGTQQFSHTELIYALRSLLLWTIENKVYEK